MEIISESRQIAELTTRVNRIAEDVAEIKQMLKAIEERVRVLENQEAGSHPIMESRIDAAWRKLDEHDKRLDNLTHVVSRLDQSNKLIAWLGGLLGSTVLIWLITQILQAIK